jgi:chemotaxis protein methyltransferase CheR
MTEQEFQEFRESLKTLTGIVLGDHKRYLVTSRMEKLLPEEDIESMEELLQKMQKDTEFRRHVMDAMTTTETTWFKSAYPFEILKDKFLPELAIREPQEVRIWSAGCFTGQEPYSLSMAVHEYLETKPGSLPANEIQIIATELSSTLLNLAKNGIFEHIESTGSGLTADRRERYFKPTNEGWQVVSELRDRIIFGQLDLREDFADLGLFDIIFCRNVLMYFSPVTRRDILTRITEMLKPGGYLVLGFSEPLPQYVEDFETVSWRDGEVYRLRN